MRWAVVNADGMVENVIVAGMEFDPGNGSRLLPVGQDVAPGDYWNGTSFVSPSTEPALVDCVSDLQFRRALTVLGLREQAEVFAANGSQDLRDYWDRALTIERRSPLVVEAARALGKSDSDIDALFALAATL